IIHRDLKPDNIMLARQLDGSDWVKVVDFGIAKSMASPGARGGGQTVTTAGVSLGTPEYMSPEQLAGETLDARTDIYSLGLVLFNMLTGKLPYPELTSKETLVRRLTSPPATLADVQPTEQWPASVQAVLSRALDPEPDRRYANVADFGRAITAAAAAGSVAEADPDATVRVPVIGRPPLAPSDNAAPRPPVASGRSPTRKLPAEPPATRGVSRTLGAAAVLLVVAVAAYAAMHAGPRTAVVPAVIGGAVVPLDSTPAPERSASAAPIAPIEPRPPIKTSLPDTVAAAVKEIRGHFVRAGQDIAGGRMLPANRELRNGRTELKSLRDQLSSGGMSPAIQRQLRELDAQPVRACYSAAASDPAATERCRLLQQRETRAARGRGSHPAIT
ncbi:MAG: protein kinase domain-containing protein, partial [Gemmatimonadaceae bacterium]